MDAAREWQSTAVALPPIGRVVETKLDDEQGVRNVQTLKRQSNLWWFPDGEMYVYYTPTHWRSAVPAVTQEEG